MEKRKSGLCSRILPPISVISLLLILLLPSCSPVVRMGESTGIAGYSYSLGTLHVLYKAGIMDTWDATLAALKEANLSITESGHGQSSGRIIAKRADETLVTVSLDYKSHKETEVSIRVGYVGERDASVKIAEAIRRILFNG